MKLLVFIEKSSGSSDVPQIRIVFPESSSAAQKRAVRFALLADITLRLESIDPLHETVLLNDSIAVLASSQDGVEEVYKNLCMVAKVAGQRKIFNQACSVCGICPLEVSVLGNI